MLNAFIAILIFDNMRNLTLKRIALLLMVFTSWNKWKYSTTIIWLVILEWTRTVSQEMSMSMTEQNYCANKEPKGTDCDVMNCTIHHQFYTVRSPYMPTKPLGNCFKVYLNYFDYFFFCIFFFLWHLWSEQEEWSVIFCWFAFFLRVPIMTMHTADVKKLSKVKYVCQDY